MIFDPNDCITAIIPGVSSLPATALKYFRSASFPQRQRLPRSERLYLKYILNIFGMVNTTWRCNQQTNSVKTDPISLNKYEISCFVYATGSTPDRIIKLDNNGQILLVCIPGKTIEQLKALNIPFTSSQIRLIKDWRLLRERNKVLKTTFPVFKIDKTKHLRNLMKESAIILGGNLEKDIISLKKELLLIGREKNIYTILFSYILNGLVWDGFKEKDVLSEREITIEKPFWNGVIWAVYPPRNFTCGTNTISDKGVKFIVNWSEVAIKRCSPLWQILETLGKCSMTLLKREKLKVKMPRKCLVLLISLIQMVVLLSRL